MLTVPVLGYSLLSVCYLPWFNRPLPPYVCVCFFVLRGLVLILQLQRVQTGPPNGRVSVWEPTTGNILSGIRAPTRKRLTDFLDVS